MSLDRAQILDVIAAQARLVGLSAREAIDRVKQGTPVHGYIWDDIALLVSLISE